MSQRPPAPPTLPDVADAKNRLLRHIGKLLELNTNIELNLSDGTFLAKGKTILYVFDETVFETFVAPRHRRLAIASHFADGLTDRSARSSQWENYETQSTLIAMEYLFSGAQARSSDTPVFITYWHEVERASRIDALMQSYALRARQNPDALTTEKKRQESLIKAYEGDGLPQGRALPDDLRHDIDRLTAEADGDIDLARFAFTREAVELMAESPVLEPTEQLARITSDRFVNRLNILSRPMLCDRFGFTTDDFEDLKAETYKWAFRIQDELSRHGRHRESGSVKSDAQSLALLCRLAARVDPDKERVVFVTTDTIMFDAYRRWDSSLTPEQKGFYDPFLIRHAVQYLPLINLINGGSDLSQSGENGRTRVLQLFDMISEAVEICLLPFNISNFGGNDPAAPERAGSRARGDLSLRLSQDRAGPDPVVQFFLKDRSSDWYTKSRESIEVARTAWQEVERIAIGNFHDLVQKRLKDDDKLLSGTKDMPLDVNSTEQMTNYLFKALEDLLQRSVNVWIPLARTAIEESMKREDDPRSRRRAPYTVWGEISNGQRLQSIISRRQRRKALAPFSANLTQPQDVFLVAAAVAIAKRDWGQAERFANLAERALSSRKSHEDLPALDARFIANLAQRFSMGQINGHLGSAALNKSSYIESGMRHLGATHAKIRDSLNSLIEIHARLADAPEHRVRLIRAHSEMAAMSLFTYASLNAARLHGHAHEVGISAEQALSDTKRHLMTCLELDRAFAPPADDAPLKQKLRAVRSQYQANFACMEAERNAFKGNLPFVIDPDIAPLTAEIKRHYDRYKDRLSAIASLEIAAFLMLYNEGSAEYVSAIKVHHIALQQSDISLDNFVAGVVADKVVDLN